MSNIFQPVHHVGDLNVNHLGSASKKKKINKKLLGRSTERPMDAIISSMAFTRLDGPEPNSLVTWNEGDQLSFVGIELIGSL